MGPAFRSFVPLAAALGIALATFGIGASVETPRSLMSRSDYLQERSQIEFELRRRIAGCRALEAPAREICRARVRAHDRVRRAELESRYEGTVDAARELAVARARAQFDIARARCLAGRDATLHGCLREARDERRREWAGTKPAPT